MFKHSFQRLCTFDDKTNWDWAKTRFNVEDMHFTAWTWGHLTSNLPYFRLTMKTPCIRRPVKLEWFNAWNRCRRNNCIIATFFPFFLCKIKSLRERLWVDDKRANHITKETKGLRFEQLQLKLMQNNWNTLKRKWWQHVLFWIDRAVVFNLFFWSSRTSKNYLLFVGD